MAIRHNVGGADKAVRIIAGMALPAFALLYGGALLRRESACCSTRWAQPFHSQA